MEDMEGTVDHIMVDQDQEVDQDHGQDRFRLRHHRRHIHLIRFYRLRHHRIIGIIGGKFHLRCILVRQALLSL